MVKRSGFGPDGDRYKAYVLGQLRCAVKRAELLANEIRAIGVALNQGAIDPDTALRDLHDARCMGFLVESEPLPLERRIIEDFNGQVRVELSEGS
jgi:hypothetical protein